MKKDEFLSELKKNLGSMPDADKQDVLSDYEEHFRVGMADGRSEEEIAQSLGNPSAIGATYCVSAMLEKPVTKGANTNQSLPVEKKPPINIAHLLSTIFLLILGSAITGLAVITFFAPLLGVITRLGSGGGDGSMTAPQRSAWEMLPVPGIALFISLMAVLFAAKGVHHDKIRRWVWIILLVLGSLILLFAAGITFSIAPAFQHMWQEIKSGMN